MKLFRESVEISGSNPWCFPQSFAYSVTEALISDWVPPFFKKTFGSELLISAVILGGALSAFLFSALVL